MTPTNSQFHSVQDIGAAETQNAMFRPSMEDVYLVIDGFEGTPDKALFCVFDGHGGRDASRDAGRTFPSIFARAVCDVEPACMPAAFKSAFNECDAGLRQHAFRGCTALVTYLDRSRNVLYVGNAGDSRAVGSVQGCARRLSCDHKPDSPEELERIMASGGWVLEGRVMGVLSVARSFGDYVMKASVISDPFVSQTPLDQVEFVIMACDGIWDVVADDEAVQFVQNCFNAGQSAHMAAHELMKLALKKGSTDNCTVIVIRI